MVQSSDITFPRHLPSATNKLISWEFFGQTHIKFSFLYISPLICSFKIIYLSDYLKALFILFPVKVNFAVKREQSVKYPNPFFSFHTAFV